MAGTQLTVVASSLTAATMADAPHDRYPPGLGYRPTPTPLPSYDPWARGRQQQHWQAPPPPVYNPYAPRYTPAATAAAVAAAAAAEAEAAAAVAAAAARHRARSHTPDLAMSPRQRSPFRRFGRSPTRSPSRSDRGREQRRWRSPGRRLGRSPTHSPSRSDREQRRWRSPGARSWRDHSPLRGRVCGRCPCCDARLSFDLVCWPY